MPFNYIDLPFTNPVLIFAVVMVLILLSPIMARRLRLPDIVGLILAGMIFGDHGIGLLARDDTMELLGKVGLLFIMFLAGLEIDLHQVKRQRSHSVVFGLLTFILPLTIGTFLGQKVLDMNFPTALLMASMFSSHTLVTFPIAARLGLTKSRATTASIGGTIITDTLALLVLAVISATVVGEISFDFWVLLGLKIVVYMAAVIILVPKIGRWFLRRFSGDENIDFIAVLAIAFSTSYLALLAGLEPIIGAFLAGLTLNSLIPEKGALMGKITFVGNSLFIPFFLLSVGMLVNVELLWQDADVWKVIAVMIPVALLAKWIAAYLFGKVMKYEADESGLVYGLSVNQAAATLAAALVGYNIGLFGESIVTGTIAMIGVTCFVGPIITEKFGRRLAASERRSLEAEGSPPPVRVMLPVHAKEKVKEVLDLAFFLRPENSTEPVYPVNVVFEGTNVEEDIDRGEKLLAHLVVRSLSINVPITPLVVVETNISTGILRAARENRVSVISMLWDGATHSRTQLFGSTIDRVVQGSSQSVLVSRLEQPLATTGRIILLCPPLSYLLPGIGEAVSIVKTIAKQSGAKLEVRTDDESRANFRKLIDRCKPIVTVNYGVYKDWKQAGSEVTGGVQLDDWIIGLAPRLGEIAWQPACDRLPHTLTAAAADNNVSFIFPPSGERQSQQATAKLMEDSMISQILPPDNCLLKADSGDVRVLLEQLLRDKIEARGYSADKVIDSLTTIAESEPVELVPGIILLHDHSDAVKDSEIFLITTTQPVQLPNIEEPARIALVLLDPPGQAPEKHLTALGNIAKLIKEPGFAEKAEKADSYEDII
ncbi:MAG: cation:proton antiporter [Verrucomicrobiota bacterium]